MSLFWHFLLWAFTVFAHDNFSIPSDDFQNKPFNQIYSRKVETNFPEIVVKKSMENWIGKLLNSMNCICKWMYWKMINELPLKKPSYTVSSADWWAWCYIRNAFFEAHVEWSICKLQETPKISYLSIEIKLWPRWVKRKRWYQSTGNGMRPNWLRFRLCYFDSRARSETIRRPQTRSCSIWKLSYYHPLSGNALVWVQQALSASVS